MRLAPSLVVLALTACGSRGDGSIDASDGEGDAAGTDDATIDGDPGPTGPVDVVITADNAYSFGYGTSTSIVTFVQGTRADGGAIFDCPLGNGPDAYVVPEADAPPTAYIYIVSWDDLNTTQGVIGEFSRLGQTVVSGDTRFEVCATGIPYVTSVTGPPLSEINTEIARCNAGTGDPATTSRGWVNGSGAITPGAVGMLAVGETNEDAGGTFPIVCHPTATDKGVRPSAKWMWYEPNDGQGGDAFHSVGTNRFKSFLIFRLGVNTLIF